MNKIAFLDRDGVINNDTGHYYIYKAEDFVFNVDVIESLKFLQKQNYLIIIITNQGGIARGTYSKNDVHKVHSFLRDDLKKHDVILTDIYFCPHHNKFESCLCRKPNSLMIERGLAQYNGDKAMSFMIGDNVKDVEAGEKAGLKSYKIDKNTSILPLVKDIVRE